MDANPQTGMVLNIQHYSLHDGPGIRTTVFLKGCSLRCKWCCNPESIHPKPELAFNPGKCIGEKACGACMAACPESAIFTIPPGDRMQVNWDLCTNCGLCVDVCPSMALTLFGKEMTVEQVLEEVEQDSTFYRESGGGISLSGGDCLCQPRFSAALLQEAHARGLNTAIETASNVPWKAVAAALPHVDTIFHDLKIMDPVRHRKWVGVDNALILGNLKRAYETFKDKRFVARSPIIPGVNDTEEHVRAVLDFILPHKNVIGYELLPYHRLGETKYGFLGRIYRLRDFKPPTTETMERLQGMVDRVFSKKILKDRKGER
jgi:pyruvate formate lyase activating enzyme